MPLGKVGPDHIVLDGDLWLRRCTICGATAAGCGYYVVDSRPNILLADTLLHYVGIVIS